MITAALFDFGGVILSSPFDAFNAYEAEAGLEPDTIRRLNATDPDTRKEAMKVSNNRFICATEEPNKAGTMIFNTFCTPG